MAYHENNRDRTVRAFLILALLCWVLTPTDLIGKPQKKPPEPPPPGVIYYSAQRDLYSVEPDGSNDSVVMTAIYDEYNWDTDASHYLHGGQRWFVRVEPIEGATYPDGLTRVEVFAVSDQGQWVQLSLDDPNLEPYIWQGTHRIQWAVHDTVVSWLGRRWATDGSGNPVVVETGIYYVVLEADVAASPTPTTPLWVPIANFPSELNPPSIGLWPDRSGFSWSPDGTQVVFATETGLSIADVGDGSVVEIDNNGPAFHPRWSPDGNLIAVERLRVEEVYGAMEVMGADGGDRQVVFSDECIWKSYARGTCYDHRAPEWSPDSLHLLFEYQVNSHSRQTSKLYRVALSGGDPFEIAPRGNTNGRPLAWTSDSEP